LSDSRLNVIAHLEELRRRLIVCAASLLAMAVICWIFSEPLLAFVVRPATDRIGNLYFLSPSDAFMARFRIAIFGGLVLSSPVILAQLWLYVSPALQGKEKKLAVPAALLTAALFLIGAAFAFYLVVPVTLDFLLGFDTGYIEPMITLGEYVSFVSGMVLSFSVAFNLPIFVAILARMGLVDAPFLVKYRRHCYVGLFVLAAILTPSPDVLSMLMLGIPLIVLYEASVIAARLIRKRPSA